MGKVSAPIFNEDKSFKVFLAFTAQPPVEMGRIAPFERLAA